MLYFHHYYYWMKSCRQRTKKSKKFLLHCLFPVNFSHIHSPLSSVVVPFHSLMIVVARGRDIILIFIEDFSLRSNKHTPKANEDRSDRFRLLTVHYPLSSPLSSSSLNKKIQSIFVVVPHFLKQEKKQKRIKTSLHWRLKSLERVSKVVSKVKLNLIIEWRKKKLRQRERELRWVHTEYNKVIFGWCWWPSPLHNDINLGNNSLHFFFYTARESRNINNNNNNSGKDRSKI